MFTSIDNKTILYTAAGVSALTTATTLWYWWDALPSVSITWGTPARHRPKSHKSDSPNTKSTPCKGTQHTSVCDGHHPAAGKFSQGSKSD